MKLPYCFLLASCLATLALTGCEKDEQAAVPYAPVSASVEYGYLTTATWLLVSDSTTTTDAAGATTVIDGYAQSNLCSQDDEWTFRKNNQLLIGFGPTRCQWEGGEFREIVRGGTWRLDGSKKKVHFDEQLQFPYGDPHEAEIVKLTATSLILRRNSKVGDLTKQQRITLRAL